MLSRILSAGLLLMSVYGASVTALYQREKVRTQTTVAELAVAANDRLTTSLGHQAAAFQAREAELRRRLELSDQVAKAASDREAAAQLELEEFRAEMSAHSAEDPTYKTWAETPLPARAVARLEALQ